MPVSKTSSQVPCPGLARYAVRVPVQEVYLPRRPCCKRVEDLPGVTYFKPRAVPLAAMEEVILSVEELEALRLAHKEDLYQQEAAARMGISRATFGRVLEAAHRKVTKALVEGCALKIHGGTFQIGPEKCERCPLRDQSVQGENPCEKCPIHALREPRPDSSPAV